MIGDGVNRSYDAYGNALVYAGSADVLELVLAGELMDGRRFVRRVTDNSGAVLAQCVGEPVVEGPDLFVRFTFTGDQTGGLLAAGRNGADLTHLLQEELATGRDLLVKPLRYAVRRGDDASTSPIDGLNETGAFTARFVVRRRPDGTILTVRYVQSQALAGSDPRAPRVRPIAARTYTLTDDDLNAVVVCSAAASVHIWVPAGLVAGFTCFVVMEGTGRVYIRPLSEAIVVTAPGDLRGLAALHQAAEIIPIGTNAYVVRGGSVVPPPFEHAPTGILLSEDIVVAGALTGEPIGGCQAIDPDPDDTFVFVLIDDIAGRFALDGAQLVVGPAGISAGDDGATLMPRIQVTDADGNDFTTDVPVFVAGAGSLLFYQPAQSGYLTVGL